MACLGIRRVLLRTMADDGAFQRDHGVASRQRRGHSRRHHEAGPLLVLLLPLLREAHKCAP